jgi:hypothetical protein
MTPKNDVSINQLQGLLVCSECQAEGCDGVGVHPIEVEVNAGGSITIVDHNGTHMRSGEASGRGVRIVLGFACESGHRFEVAFQFHKGSTTIDPRLLSAAGGDFTTIWRD